jgi:hypothetical protein
VAGSFWQVKLAGRVMSPRAVAISSGIATTRERQGGDQIGRHVSRRQLITPHARAKARHEVIAHAIDTGARDEKL